MLLVLFFFIGLIFLSFFSELGRKFWKKVFTLLFIIVGITILGFALFGGVLYVVELLSDG
jgi:hypothetical protein